MRSFVLGAAGAFGLAYTTQRTVEAVRAAREPSPQAAAAAPHDAHVYGAARRRLMLVGIARSFAQLGFTAYAVAPAIEAAAGDTTRPLRRAALVAAGVLTANLLDLPADYVEDFAFERRFGLSDQPARSWLGDRAKGVALSVAVTVPLLELLAAAMARAPRRWPALATAGTIPLLVLANLIVPLYVMPLFNKFEPYAGPLEARILALAARYGVAEPTILRVDMSRQTKKANAYVTGLFGTNRIVLGDTLLDHFADDEVLFVTAHELGHYVSRDVWRSVALGTLASAAIFGLGARLGRRGSNEPAHSLGGLARFFFASSLVSLAAGPALAAASRERERAADRFALAATKNAGSGARAFERLRERNLAEDEQPRWMELLFSSHPSLKSRIATLRAAEAEALSA